MPAPGKILELVDTFERHAETYRAGAYNETQARQEFINPLFKCLGWDMDNEQGHAEAYKDVIHEDAMKDYHINVFYSEKDGCYVGDRPDLRFCSAFGASAAEAVQEVQIVKAAWLKAARQRGKPLPKPTYRPAIYQIAR